MTVNPTTPSPPDGPLWVDGAIPAATVILIRDGASGIETLMLRRDGKLSFAAGMWVFPGGRIDPEDGQLPGLSGGPRGTSEAGGASESGGTSGVGGAIEADGPSGVGGAIEADGPSGVSGPAGREQLLEVASLRAAVREAHEETGLALDPASLRRWSHWTAPVEAPKRFTTAFYVADLGPADVEVTIDNSEIREFVWKSPAEVITGRDEGVLGLTPPTFITLTQLLRFQEADAVIGAAGRGPVEHFETRFDFVGNTMIAMYHGDAGYVSGDVHAEGPRHRLSMDSVWRYERDA